jgi:hypothetical protein
MAQVDDNRRLHVHIPTMKQFVERDVVVRADPVSAEASRQRYGDYLLSEGDAIGRVQGATAMAKRMLATDKVLASIAWLLRGERIVGTMGVVFRDRESLSVQMHRLADLVERVDADGMVFFAESWHVVLDSRTDMGGPVALLPSERANRSEAIWVIGITRDGRTAESETLFFRGTDGKIFFGPTGMVYGRSVKLMEPIVKKWQQLSGAER